VAFIWHGNLQLHDINTAFLWQGSSPESIDRSRKAENDHADGVTAPPPPRRPVQQR
jgi:hypothetical protein